jgi:hypothetical protein
MALLTFFCSWCNDHEFKLDENTVRVVGILKFQCPKCEKITTIGVESGGGIIILPGSPKASAEN